jgi:small-conductance mechanosensitive channel
MTNLQTWTELLWATLHSISQRVIGIVPNIIAAFLILFFGWLLAQIVSKGIQKLLNVVKFDTISDNARAMPFLKNANFGMQPSILIEKFVYYTILLLVTTTAAETLGWTVVSAQIARLLNYLPNLLSAILLFVVGIYASTFVRDFLRGATASLGLSTGKLVSNLVFYLLFIIVALTAIEQTGINTSVISSNLLMIVGTVLAAAAISYGFASKDILSNILAGFFSKRIFRRGQIIEIDGIKGRIVDINNVALIIQSSETERVVIPMHQVITSKVKIID